MAFDLAHGFHGADLEGHDVLLPAGVADRADDAGVHVFTNVVLGGILTFL
ncbi:Replication protein A 32 kDa subunit [Caligus rogercresseyi]|uniref:Replication protein A 32 kDa subunit n=1 Tax=Caligus rogercresseyi TaxID=217165 RepID=A0A7T8GRH0_CALRO|nr:Replication protein A 32 kDa subunit [Caligus rogercresseyi]